MARGFGSTYGSGTTDSILTGYSTAPSASAISISAWYYKHAQGGANAGHLVDTDPAASNNNFVVSVNASNTSMKFYINNIGTGGPVTWTDNGLGVWQHLCLTYNGSSGSNLPNVYVNGTKVTTSGSFTGAMSANAQALYIGNSSAGSRNWDGLIAEFGYWNGALLTAAEALALSKGMPPLFVRPASLTLYMPLHGLQTNEQDWGPNRVSATVTGAKRQNHAPASFWMPPGPAAFPGAAHFSGSLALTQTAATVALSQAEKFHASAGAGQGANSAALALHEKFASSIAALQPNAATAITVHEKFAEALALAQSADTAAIFGHAMAPAHPGRALVSDAVQGGLLKPNDATLYGLASADAALYDVHISESV